MAQTVTFTAVVVGWVFFRAETLGGAMHILSTMFGASGLSLSGISSSDILGDPVLGLGLIMILFVIAWVGPNSTQYISQDKGNSRIWRPTLRHAVLIAALFCFSFFHIESHSEFLYFQF